MGGVSSAGKESGGENFTLGSSTVERPTVVVWLSAGRWFDSAPGDFSPAHPFPSPPSFSPAFPLPHSFPLSLPEPWGLFRTSSFWAHKGGYKCDVRTTPHAATFGVQKIFCAHNSGFCAHKVGMCMHTKDVREGRFCAGPRYMCAQPPARCGSATAFEGYYQTQIRSHGRPHGVTRT